MTSPVPKEILAQHVVILGKTRSGKSSVMRLLVEGLLERQLPVCIVDPKGDWYGVKLAADGKRPGYPVVIFGGEHADIPINEHAGAHVAELFATGNRPCLIDLGGWMPGPRTQFWIDFASTLFRFTKGNRWLAIDEMHNFAPKGKVLDPQAGKALHWANRLASEGLGKGLAMVFASQRPQKVHNDTLTSAETLIAMRVLHPSDRGAVADWIKGCGDSEGGEVLNSLAQMERGEGWAWSPEIGFGPKRVKFPMFKTYDSFRPQSVEDTKKLKGWAEVDLDDVRVKMAATIEKAKADDPKALRLKIRELEQQLAKLSSVIPQKTAETPPPSRPILTDADRELARSLLAKMDNITAALAIRPGAIFVDFEDRLRAAMTAAATKVDEESVQHRAAFLRTVESKGLQKILAKLEGVAVTAAGPGPGSMTVSRVTTPQRGASDRVAPRAATTRPVARAAAADNGHLPPGERATLTAALQYDGIDRKRLGILTGYKRSSRDAYIVRLAAKGLIDVRGAQLFATDAGRAALSGSFEPLPTGAALIEYWRERLPEGERKTLDVLIAHDGREVAREVIDDTTGYKRSSRDAYLVRLKTRGLVEYAGRGTVKASDELFD